MKILRYTFCFWLFCMLFLFPALQLRATTYYVHPGGNNANNGLSPATAWADLTNPNLTTFLPGDSLLLAGGTIVTGTLTLNQTDAGGGNINPVYIGSYGIGRATIQSGTSFGIHVLNTAGLVIDRLELTGSGMATNLQSGLYLENNLAGNIKLPYLRITNLEISGYRESGLLILGNNQNSGFSDVVIQNCEVHDILGNGIVVLGDFSTTKVGYAHSNLSVISCQTYQIPGYSQPIHSGSGIVVSDVQVSSIEFCVAYDCGSGNTACGGPVGIWYFDADQVLIQHCEAYQISSGTGCDGGGFDLDGGVTNGVMQYNYSHDNDGAGYLIGQFSNARPMSNIICRYNISERDAQTNGGSVYLFNLSPSIIDNVQIYNNTFYQDVGAANPTAAVFKMLNFNPGYQNISACNNVFYAQNGDLIYIPAGVGYDADFFGNLYFSAGPGSINYKGTLYPSLATFRTGSGKEILTGVNTGVEGNPALNGPGAGGTIGFGNPLNTLFAYQLNLGSLATDQGLNLQTQIGVSPGTQDFYGNPPLSGATQDIGAYEGQTILPNALQEEIEEKVSLNEKLISVFPTMVRSEVTISQQTKMEWLQVRLFDQAGRLVLLHRLDSPQSTEVLSIPSDLSTGIYTLRVNHPRGAETAQIIIH